MRVAAIALAVMISTAAAAKGPADCWNITSSDWGKAAVRIQVDRIEPDGTVLPSHVRIVDDGGDAALARKARRAAGNPACQPWDVPSGGWPKTPFVVTFDPTPAN